MKFTIEQARNYKGYTQAEMAEKLGVSRQGYIDYENGKSYMRVDKAYLFSKIVDIDNDSIIFFGDELHLKCSE